MKFADVIPGNWYETKPDSYSQHGNLVWIPKQALPGHVQRDGLDNVHVSEQSRSGYVWHPSHDTKNTYLRSDFCEHFLSGLLVEHRLSYWDDLPKNPEEKLIGVRSGSLLRLVPNKKKWEADKSADRKAREEQRQRDADAHKAEKEAQDIAWHSLPPSFQQIIPKYSDIDFVALAEAIKAL